MRPWLLVAITLTGCAEPAWLEDCDCGEDVCVLDGDGTRCEAVPDTCADLYTDKCDESAPTEIDCVIDLCGDFTGDWSFEWDCHKTAKRVYRFADCTQVPDSSPVE
jgi:hypothetical protein